MGANVETITAPTLEGERFPDPAAPTTIVADAVPESALALSAAEADERMVNLKEPGKILHFGPYRVQASDPLLGKGGMGVVYRGEHAETHEVVAIKVVKNVCARHFDAIHREIDALRRVPHPNIVRILADGRTNEGLPWVAMSFIEGITLGERLRSLRTTPTGDDASTDESTCTADSAGERPRKAHSLAGPLGPTLTLIRRLCAPLAFLHGEGLVHRDLKPDNILIQSDDRPVLIDLGITGHFGGADGREELDIDPPFGTKPYTAPEQLKGEMVDARADLYALGCILYECVTGQPLSETERISPSLRVSGLPQGLDELVLKLLARYPRDRLGYATDVAAALVKLGAKPEPLEGPQPRVYVYRSELCGREQPMATLKKALHDVEHRRGGITLVHGESGVGKTRLAREIAQFAAGPRHDTGPKPIVLRGSCVAEVTGEPGVKAALAPPLHPLRSVLVAAIQHAQGSRTEADRLVGQRSKVLSDYVASLQISPGQTAQEELPPLPPDKARARVLDALREAIWALSRTSPLVIVLDDIQWADDLTLSLIESLANIGLGTRGVLIIATYREEEMHPDLSALTSKPGIRSIPLPKLDARNIGALVKGMLAQSAPDNVIDALANHSNGNPFFVAEYLRAAIEEGFLQRDERGRFCFDTRSTAAALSSLPLPQTLAEIIKRRLDRLDRDEKEGKMLADWAAVIGQQLDTDLLLSYAPGGNTPGVDASLKGLSALKRRHILEDTHGGGLRFVHDKIREIIYQRIPCTARAALHLRAGAALERLYAAVPEKAQVLGHHFAQAGRHKKASRYFTSAAKYARKVYANSNAIRFYQLAIDALMRLDPASIDRTKLANLHEGLGDVLILSMQAKEAKAARRAYRAALGVTLPSVRLAIARLHRKVGKTWELQDKYPNALSCYKRADALLGPTPIRGVPSYKKAWWVEWFQIRLDCISVHYWRADVKGIRILIESIQPFVYKQGYALQRGHYFHALTQRNIQIEQFVPSDETLGYARDSLAAYESARGEQKRHLLLDAQFNVAFILMLQDSLEKAEAQMANALHDAERVGDIEVQARCLTYLTMIHRRSRHIGQVRDLAARSLELAKANDTRQYSGAALGNLSWLALSRNDHAEAMRTGQDALDCWKPLQIVYPFQWLARLPLCFVASRQHRWPEAIVHAEAVLKPKQQRLPQRLTNHLREAIEALVCGNETYAEKAFLGAFEEALKRGYT